MAEFMAKKIMQYADISVEEGQDKYRAYFVNTKIYARYQDEVDTILNIDGYGACIVAK